MSSIREGFVSMYDGVIKLNRVYFDIYCPSCKFNTNDDTCKECKRVIGLKANSHKPIKYRSMYEDR